MSKNIRFNIHDWQAKQKRKQLLNEELGPQSPKIELLTDRILNVMGGRLATWQNYEQITNSHDMMALYERDKEKLRMMIYNLLRDDLKEEPFEGNAFGKAMQGAKKGDTVKVGDQEFTKKEHHDDEDFPGKDLSAWDLLDKLKSGDKELYDRVEDFMKSMNEMSSTGTGASVSAGAGEAFATPNAFKKKRK